MSVAQCVFYQLLGVYSGQLVGQVACELYVAVDSVHPTMRILLHSVG